MIRVESSACASKGPHLTSELTHPIHDGCRSERKRWLTSTPRRVNLTARWSTDYNTYNVLCRSLGLAYPVTLDPADSFETFDGRVKILTWPVGFLHRARVLLSATFPQMECVLRAWTRKRTLVFLLACIVVVGLVSTSCVSPPSITA